MAISTLLLSLSVQASVEWNDKGSGSDVILCEDASRNMVYDFYEAEVRHKFKLVLPEHWTPVVGGSGPYSGLEDLQEVLSLARAFVDRLKPLDPDFHSKLLGYLLEFPAQLRFLAKTKLLEIADQGMLLSPEKCKSQQLVLQRSPRFPQDKRFTISLEEWKQISTPQKAISVLHEVLYFHARDLNSQLRTSEPIRYFNALLISDAFKDMSYQEYLRVYEDIFLWIY